MGETHMPANREIILRDVSGNTMEQVVEIDPQKAREICICVLRSPEAEEYTAAACRRETEGDSSSRMRW